MTCAYSLDSSSCYYSSSSSCCCYYYCYCSCYFCFGLDPASKRRGSDSEGKEKDKNQSVMNLSTSGWNSLQLFILQSLVQVVRLSSEASLSSAAGHTLASLLQAQPKLLALFLQTHTITSAGGQPQQQQLFGQLVEALGLANGLTPPTHALRILTTLFSGSQERDVKAIIAFFLKGHQFVKVHLLARRMLEATPGQLFVVRYLCTNLTSLNSKAKAKGEGRRG